MPDAEPPRRLVSRIDMHSHSAFSKDALGGLDELAAAARAKGLQGVCLVEHDTMGHVDPVAAWNDAHAAEPFRFFAGVEISARGGHVLAVGLGELVPYGLAVPETVQRVVEQGAVAIPAHPFRRGSGIGPGALDLVAKDLVAVEVFNAQELGGGNRMAAAWAVSRGLGGTGGSDAHQVHDVGNGYTEFAGRIRDLAELLAALRSGESWGVGRRTGLATLVRQGLRNRVRRWRGELVVHR